MTFLIRPAGPDDLQTLYEMAKLTGGGFTNLPPDRAALSAKIERTQVALARAADVKADELIVLVLENAATGQVRGTCQIFSEVGQQWPFFSYRLSVMTQHSRELARTFRAEILTLTTDLEGSTEVGGLFLHPRERAEGLGQLLTRSRYLYIRQHRARFGDRVIAELRGVIDEAGGSPFWDGLAGRFFGMNFQEADEFNAIHGNQFIADLMPKTPIYTAMLTDSARSVIGLPHPSGRAAMRMLEAEGLTHTGYVDIFDGGPTMVGETDKLRTIAGARDVTITGVLDQATAGERVLAAFGQLADYRCTSATLTSPAAGEVHIDAESLKLLGASVGDTIAVVTR
jgi:arginine N-succinyltransferase